jgi:hypothetical protein
MSEIINLKTRYHTKNYLEQYQGNTYILRTESPYIRAGSTNDGKEFVDPSGGPMIVVGYELEEAKAVVKSIDFVEGYGWVITFC